MAYAAALGVLALLLGAGAALGRTQKEPEHEQEVEVKLVTTAEPPPPPPPAPPPPPTNAPPPAPRKAAQVTTPTQVPDEKPPEVDPSQAKPALPVGEGDPNGVPGGTGTAKVSSTNTAPEPPPPPPPAPKPTGPIQLPEDADPPVAISKPMPAYPDDARSQGVEAVIVVKFVVTESGDVVDVKIVRGHPMFDARVLEAVQTWKFSPAKVEGKPISVYRIVKIPFKLKS